VRQKVDSDATQFAVNERRTDSAFASVNEAWSGQRAEASWRYDDDDSFGQRHTGSASYGFDLWGLKFSTTAARGFRAPTFYDLYGPTSDFYVPNPNLRPEQNKSTEIAVRSGTSRLVPFDWKVVAFDNRIDDLIAYTFPTVVNVNSARIKGVELGAQGTFKGVRWQASYTGQRPRDETTGLRLQGRAESYGTATGTYTWGSWSGGMTVHASGDRYDSPDESPGTRLGGYATLDARVRYKAARQWTVELAATNLTDKRYETSVGYEGARRGVMLAVRFDAF